MTREFYQRVLMEVVKAGGDDALLALKVIAQWEFEALCEQEFGMLSSKEVH